MRAEKAFSKVAWGEREVGDRSAKRSAAMVVTTFAALLIFCNSLSHSAQQTGSSTNGIGPSIVARVKAGNAPGPIAFNPEANKIYVANRRGSSVTVIDGDTNVASTVKVGSSPDAIAVNSVTNKIYVACRDSNSVWVIDGATNSVTKVETGKLPGAIAVNPVTNTIYVVTAGNGLTVIDGATNATARIATGKSPFALAVNAVTNKIYVANEGSDDIAVIDGVTNSTITVKTVLGAGAIAVNPITNKIYMTHRSYYPPLEPISGCFFHRRTACTNKDGGVTVIDGATNEITTVPTGTSPEAVVVNTVTNKIYVAGYGNAPVGGATVIDGVTNKTSLPGKVGSTTMTNLVPGTVRGLVTQTETGSTCLTVNENTNKIYVTYSGYFNDDDDYTNGGVMVIDGVSGGTAVTVLKARATPRGVVLNPVTHKIYVTDGGNDVVLVFE